MQQAFDECLKKGKIIRFAPAKKLAANELDTARKDLSTSKQSLKLKNHKWATIQAYYAMFHAARSLLYAKGYREKSHYCLILAIKSFYAGSNILEARLLESFQAAKALREAADYENTYDAESAKALVAQAGEFVNIAEKIVFQ